MAASQQQSLTAAKKSLLQLADYNQVVSALARLQVSGDASWLPSTNPYAVDAQAQIKADQGVVPSQQQRAFADYLAASAFVHCGDAWGYLGRAVDALVRGDLHAEVHLTYYAELRGAIALLGAEGIYVGDRANLVITSDGSVEQVSKEGTHTAVWKFVEAWSGFPRSSAVIGKVLRPGGVSLDSWVGGLPGGAIGPIVADLFANIAFDLQSFSTDRVRRNTASYSPSRLSTADLSTTEMCRIVSHLWTSLEPDVRGGFPVIDQLLLRNTLTGVFGSVHTVEDEDGVPTGDVDWSGWEGWLQSITPTQSASTALYEQLRSEPVNSQSDAILAAAFTNDIAAVGPKEFIESMLARTTVLLRLSTGMCIRLLEDSGIDQSSIDPWVDSLSLSRGLWSVDEPPENRIDLWADTELARDLLDDAANLEPHGVLDFLKSHTVILGQTERVVAWSFS